MGEFVGVEERVEFPSAERGVGLAIRGTMVGGFVVGTEPGDEFGCGHQKAKLLVSILEGLGVPFLARGLILLIVLFALAIEAFTSDTRLPKIAVTGLFEFAVNRIHGVYENNVCHGLLCC